MKYYTWLNEDETKKKNYTKWKKLDRKDHLFYSSIYKKYLE